MNRENLLFAIIGILFGFILGFIFASTMSQKTGPNAPQTVAGSQTLPADHPPTGGAPAAPADPQAVRAQVTESIEQARKEPKNCSYHQTTDVVGYRVAIKCRRDPRSVAGRYCLC